MESVDRLFDLADLFPFDQVEKLVSTLTADDVRAEGFGDFANLPQIHPQSFGNFAAGVYYSYFPREVVWQLVARDPGPPTGSLSDYRGQIIIGDDDAIWAEKSRYQVGDPDGDCAGLNDLGHVEQIGPVENTAGPWDTDNGSAATWSGGATSCVDENFGAGTWQVIGPATVDYTWGYCERDECP